MTRDKGFLFRVVLLAAFLFSAADVRSQTFSDRASGGGVIQQARSRAATAPLLTKRAAADPLPAGSYTVGTAGYFPTLDSAFSRLSGGGILGPVTLFLIDTLYVASPAHNNMFALQGPISGTGPASRVTIRPADNVAATIKGNGESVIWVENVSYLTLDGMSLQGNTRMKVQSVYNPATTYSDAIDFFGDCDHAIIQNLTALSEDNRKSFVIAVYSDSTGGGPDSCLVSGVSVPSGWAGIYVGGWPSSYRATGCSVRGNHIGSPDDSLISRGIQVEIDDGTVVDGNHVENIHAGYPPPYSTDQYNYVLGINAYFSRNTVIRNNVVHNVCATMPQSYVDGILLSGSASYRGANVWVYNNMVYDIRTLAIGNVDLNGIGAWQQDSVRVDHNSVYLSPTGGTYARWGSSALGFYSTAFLSTARNNILVNMREELASFAVAIWFGGNNWKLSDYNDLHVGQYDSSFVASYGAKGYKSIDTLYSDGKEVHSVSVMPPFVSSQNLHLTNTASALADAATPIPGIATDIDGDPRPTPGHAAPDMGADEFVHPTGVDEVEGVPRSFALEQNYPNPFNPTTVVSYRLPVAGNVRLVVYDLLGREVSVLENERRDAGVHEVKFDGAGLASGVYFYRLQVRPLDSAIGRDSKSGAGDFVQTRKLLLLR